MAKSSKDLTNGNIVKLLVLFALPILAGEVFQNLYNSVDSIIVGKFVSKTGLAAVSSGADISQLLIGFFTGLSAGSGVVFSRYFGSKKYDKMHDSIHTALTFALILGLIMTVVGIVICPTLLEIVKCPSDVFDEALSYLRIYLIGVLFTSIYNVGAGVLRAVGNSRSPFIYLVVSSLLNVVLDLIFVIFFKMGVNGAALATIISQLVSVILVFWNMLDTDDVYKVRFSDLKIDIDLLKEVIVIGMPAAISSCLISISNLFVQGYINKFGSSAMAGIGAAKKVDKFAGLISQSMGIATATFIAQNHGAGKLDRCFKAIWSALALSVGSFLVVGSLIYFNAKASISLFTDDIEAVSYGADMIITMIPLFPLQCLLQVMQNTNRGFGHSSASMVLTISGLILFRQIFLYISMNLTNNVRNVYLSYPIGWAVSSILLTGYYLLVVKRKLKK